jgi:chitinase
VTSGLPIIDRALPKGEEIKMGRQMFSLVATLFLAGVTLVASAGAQTYTTIDYPGSVADLAVDINDSGQIVGEYTFTDLSHRHGFLLSDGVFTDITYPGAIFTRAIGINRYGDIVADHSDIGNPNNGNGNDYGYLLRGGVFTSIVFPNSDATIASGINANGDIVGWYLDKIGMHGFLLSGGVYSSIDFPGAAAYTQAWKINDAGELAGRYKGANDGKYHMFVLNSGTFTTIPDVPCAFETAVVEAGGLNSAGHMVSQYCSAKPCGLGSVGDVHGFFVSGGVYTKFDVPGALLTMAFGINFFDNIVGGYQDSTGVYHGYLRTP